MISTADKNEIEVGEPNYPISVLTRKKRVLVAHGQSLQACHHDFSKVSLVPTVAFSHDIPNTVNESFYRGTPYVYLKAHATEPSSAIRNAKEIAHVLIEKYESKEKVPPMEEEVEFSACANRNDCLTTLSQLGLTDRSTHGTWQFVYQPPHTPPPPAPHTSKKMNCVLNLGQNAIEYIRSAVHSGPGFEKHLLNCQGVNDVRNLLEKNLDQNAKLLKESRSNCLDLIKAIFLCLQLEENIIQERDAIVDSEVSSFLKEVNLDKLFKPTDQKPDLAERLLLAQYLSHSCRLRTYLASIKKCGSSECTVCLPSRLPNEIFERIRHLPDPTPDESNEGHYSKFREVFGYGNK